MVKKAFILAAGLGTRLGSESANKPKALFEITGKPMLQILIEKLKAAGFTEIVINIHYFGQQIIDFLTINKNFNVGISISDERDQLQDTGGALLKAREFFVKDEPILVHNVDVISDMDIKTVYDYHLQNQAIATLCVRKRNSSRVLLFNDEMELIGWKNITTNNYKWASELAKQYNQFAFSGIYVINSGFIDKLPFQGKFSIIDAWLNLAKNNLVSGFVDHSAYWFDLGTPGKIEEAENYLTQKNIG